MVKVFRNVRKKLASENLPTGQAGKVAGYLRYAFGEIFLVVVGILIALSINTWNDNRKESLIENKILTEISNGLSQDLIDIKSNRDGHLAGLKACDYWGKIINNEKVNSDSVRFFYHYLVRDFLSIQNTSGYEYLKSKGLELITNDSIRIEITTLYEQHYNFLRKLEEDYQEMQFQKEYFKDINNIVSPYLVFNQARELKSIRLPLKLSESEKQLFISYLWKIKKNRLFILELYSGTEQKIKQLQEKIDKEISQN
ncbi:MAG: DUF6090 family protein [Ignavibacteriota bacterium]